MENVIEYGCEICGGMIMKPVPKPSDGGNTYPSACRCDECGHVTNVSKMCGFQCSPNLQSFLHRFFKANELNQLRLDPYVFAATLSRNLIAANKPALEVDTSTRPPTVREIER